MKLVTLQQASDHLRRDTSDDDADLELKVEAASQIILNYLGAAIDSFTDSAGFPFIDSAGDPLYIPTPVQIATLFLIGYLYSNRGYGDSRDNAFDADNLPKPIVAILTPIKSQVFA